jgi:uncharacterized Rmd1/YagE family protein
VYFCCVSSDIDVQKLFDYLVGAGTSGRHGWKYHLYDDVLHLYKPGIDDSNRTSRNNAAQSSTEYVKVRDSDYYFDNGIPSRYSRSDIPEETYGATSSPMDTKSSAIVYTEHADPDYANHTEAFQLSANGAQEAFVFDFGAVVFWGFSRGEETNLLKTIRMFVTKGFVGVAEYQSGEDDMAFVVSPEASTISIANDVITLPELSVPKDRLSVSFAIAQSSVLAIFEARIEQKVEEYKYIPTTLAAYGRVHLSARKLGMMIGEVFVIRHDVNLHTEILDTPDFFWNEKFETFDQQYRMVLGYLEMPSRTEVLNTRLDMLRELLDVLQQQLETAHGVKLEWIVIWLIVAEVVLQLAGIVVNKYK